MNAPIDSSSSDAPEQITWIKANFPKEYDDAKHVSHLSNYMGTPWRIKQEFPESFPTIASAESIQRLYFETIATRVRAWQQEVLREAHEKLYLQTPFGYRHYFWDVRSSGKDAVAFLPQSTACDIGLRAIEACAHDDFIKKSLRLFTHDSIMFELPNDKHLDRRIEWIQKQMQLPVGELDGLTVGTTVAIGRTWADL